MNQNKYSIEYKEVLSFYQGKKVLITGNTGFKGAWLTHILLSAGATVIGYSLKPPTNPSLFQLIELDKNEKLNQIYGDVRDLDKMKAIFEENAPEIVFHLAAQPIVRDSYKNPVETYSTNVMGTVHVCECVRSTVDNAGKPVVKSFLNITTDKVYKNNEWEYGYRESDVLDGFDPYSNSKSCSELVTHSYRDAFFKNLVDVNDIPLVRVSTARAGNVIGGGDFSNDRIIPDCVRTLVLAQRETTEGIIKVRNPYSTRPYEHVLEPLFVYLLIAKCQYENDKYTDCYNVGPDEQDCVTTGELVTLFCDIWNNQDTELEKSTGTEKEDFRVAKWISMTETGSPHEANFLKLDCSKLKATFSWKPVWHIDEAIRQTVAWTKIWMNTSVLPIAERAEIIRKEMDREIALFVNV